MTHGTTTADRMAFRTRLHQTITSGFLAAIHRRRAHRETGVLLTAVDLLPHPLAVYSPSGSMLHRNPAMRHLLAAEPARLRLETIMHQLVRAVVHRPRTRAMRSVERALATSRTEYRLRANAQPLEGGVADLVVVTIERLEARAGVPAEDRYDLTPRELQLAQLAAEGMTNNAIAERLGLSRFTVRNHLERVFAKVGVKRRGELARAFLR